MNLSVTLVDNADALRGLAEPTDIIVLPELADGGYAALRRGEGIHMPDDAYLDDMRDLSRCLRCTCIAGSLSLRRTRGGLTNSSLVFRNGRCIHRYDKIHLFKPAAEERLFRPGKSNGVFTVHSGRNRIRVGVIICYDLRFPELARMLALGGMQVLFVPARWPAVRDDAWRTLLKARAIENQIFVVGCNASGKEGGTSYVFDPVGQCLMTSADTPDQSLRRVVLDLERIREAQAMHTNLRDAVLLRKIRFPSVLRSP